MPLYRQCKINASVKLQVGTYANLQRSSSTLFSSETLDGSKRYHIPMLEMMDTEIVSPSVNKQGMN